MKFILFLTLVFILSVTACEKECIVPELYFNLIGFSDTEADTIVLRRFEKNNSSTPIDTFAFDQIGFNRSNDTLEIASIPGNFSLRPEYNYEIYFPEGGRLIRVTDITEEKRSSNKGLFNCNKEQCLNGITGYTVDGQFSNAIVGWQYIYLKK
jgi:hypothetical protein